MTEPRDIPEHVVDAAVTAYHADLPRDRPRRMAMALAAALDALGCEWDDDQGHNSHRRIVGAWLEWTASVPSATRSSRRSRSGSATASSSTKPKEP